MKRNRFLMYVALAGVFTMLSGCEKYDPGCCYTIAADTATPEITIKPDTIFIYIPQKDGTKRRVIWFIDDDPTDDFP